MDRIEKKALDDFIFGPTGHTEQRAVRLRQRLGGVVHGNRIDPLAPHPQDVVTLSLWVGDEQRIDSACCYFTVDGSDPQGSRGQPQGTAQSVVLWPSNVEWLEQRWSFGRWWRCQLPPQPEGTTVRYRLEAFSAFDDASVWADDGRRFSYFSSDLEPPAWVKDAVIYHIFIDRFYPGIERQWLKPPQPTGFFGGTLQGVIEKLDYLADLGMTALWLSPIFASPSHHGYDCIDYYNIDPRYGDNETLKRLVQAAHKRGLRVLLDYVANHCSKYHPFFLEAQKDKNSPYYPWFTFMHWPDHYASFFGIESLPQWNLDYPPARQYIIDAACHWLREYKVDGYRLDYTLGPSHDFWTDFHAAVRRTAPDAFCIAEAVESPDVMRSYSGRIEGCLDFPLLEVVRHVFGNGSMTVAQLDAFLTYRAAFFPRQLILGTFLDNHDMNRFLWMAGGDKQRLKLAALCQFTLSSPPIVYYGTEVGVAQTGDVRGAQGNAYHHHARTPMLWGDDQDGDLLRYYQALARLRREHPALRDGTCLAMYLDAAAGAYVYCAKLLDDQVIVALNVGDAPAEVSFALPSAMLSVALTDALTGNKIVTSGDHVSATLPALSGMVLVP